MGDFISSLPLSTGAGAVSRGHFSDIGFDLMLAVYAPDDQRRTWSRQQWAWPRMLFYLSILRERGSSTKEKQTNRSKVRSADRDRSASRRVRLDSPKPHRHQFERTVGSQGELAMRLINPQPHQFRRRVPANEGIPKGGIDGNGTVTRMFGFVVLEQHK